MNITIILVNYKCDKNKLQKCLNSIRVKSNIIIVDHSNDFNLDGISLPDNLNISVIQNVNDGNGAGINCGVRNSNTKYVLYLDIDTVLSENFFEILNKSINKIDDFAIIAPKIENFYDNVKINRKGNLSLFKFYYNKFFYNLNFKQINDNKNIKEVFFVSGSIMLINKKNTYENDIKFDENIFMFFEEDDFFHQCFKLKKKIFLIENLKAKHLDGSVSDNSLNYECFKKWHWERSKFYFLNKHYNNQFVFLIALKSIIKFSIKVILFYFINRDKFLIYKSRLNGLLSYYQKKPIRGPK